MRVKIFLIRGSEKKLADAHVLVEEGDFRGANVRGWNVWKGKGPGEIFVSPPNQAFTGRDGKKKYYHHVVDEVEGALNPIKRAIEEAYRAKVNGTSEPAPAGSDDDFPI